jgi:S-DNA-T family DNA segregation ATPase FtsK/SpoIIIE
MTEHPHQEERGGDVLSFRPRHPSPQPRADQPGEAGRERATVGDTHDVELVDADGDGYPDTTHAGDLVRRAGDQVEHQGPVLDAELVDDAEPGTALVRITRPVTKATRPVVRAVRVVRHHEPTVRVTRGVARQGAYVAAGVVVLARRFWEAKTNSRYERMMRTFEAAGDYDRVAEWEQRAEQARERRHRRHMDLLALPFKIAKALLLTLVIGLVGLLLLGGTIAVANEDLSLVLAPMVGTFTVIAWTVTALVTLFGVLVFAAPFVLVAGLRWVGKHSNNAPRWLVKPDTEPGHVMDGLPDETMIVEALRKTVPALDRALKDGWRMHYRKPPMPDGKGWRAQLDLPPAAPVEEFVKRKLLLAHNLKRYPIEVWPTEPLPAVLDLWVANPGVLSKPVDPWPLLDELDTAQTDYFEGVPVGVTIKGDVIKGRLSEANYAVGGMMGSGKSTLVITILLGAMLDPLVDIDVVVMAENADYDPMRPRLNTLVTGAGEETVEQCLAMLHERYQDIAIRGAALREHDQRAVTRRIAEKDARLRPRIMVIDECQNLFIGEHGKAAIEVTTKLMSTARKYGVTLLFLTPEPSKDALPRKLITIASNKACFAIGDHQGNDAVLGSGSYKSGISAVGLTPKTDDGPGDVGTCMQRGFTGKPGLMRCFYVPQSDAHRVTKRALQLREGRRAGPTVRLARERDLLADLAEVLHDVLPIAQVPPLLKHAWPRHVPYQRLDGQSLRERLAVLGVQVPSTGNRWPLDPARVREALNRRREGA